MRGYAYLLPTCSIAKVVWGGTEVPIAGASMCSLGRPGHIGRDISGCRHGTPMIQSVPASIDDGEDGANSKTSLPRVFRRADFWVTCRRRGERGGGAESRLFEILGFMAKIAYVHVACVLVSAHSLFLHESIAFMASIAVG